MGYKRTPFFLMDLCLIFSFLCLVHVNFHLFIFLFFIIVYSSLCCLLQFVFLHLFTSWCRKHIEVNEPQRLVVCPTGSSMVNLQFYLSQQTCFLYFEIQSIQHSLVFLLFLNLTCKCHFHSSPTNISNHVT